MVKAESIKSFFNGTPIAIIGVSRNKKHFGAYVYENLKKKGILVIAVNPKTDNIEGDICYPDLKSIPNRIESAVIITGSKNTDDIAKEAVAYGIKNLWIQQKSDTKSAIELAEKNNINVIHHQCIMMYANPVKGMHKFHKGMKKLFGQLPK